MTTSSRPGIAADAAAAAAEEAGAPQPLGILTRIDPATIERIAANMFSAMGLGAPGAVPFPSGLIPPAPLPSGSVPSAASPGAALVAPGVPEAVPAVLSPGAAVPMALPGAAVPGTPSPSGAIPANVIPGTAVPASLPTNPVMPNASIPGSAIPGAAPVSLPTASTLALATEDMDGAVPRLFDEPPGRPASAPGYYFLTPPLATQSATSAPALHRRAFVVQDIKRDFPILKERIHGKPLVWLDNAATTQKPRAVIERVSYYYEHEYSNVHRAAHTLAARSTEAYESAREKLARFLGASSPSEIVFVRGTTEAINLVANSWGRRHLSAGDEIVLTTLEHHSNIVPWQFVAEATGAVIRVVPVTDRGEVMLDDYGKLLGPRTRMVAFTHVSNALGTVLPALEMVQMAHRVGAKVLVDGAQAVAHFPVNVQALDADFYVLSGHKLFGPSGVGVMYGKKALLDEMPPWQGGGNMIQRVTFEKSTFADPPARFEAGTATLGPAVGLGAAVDYLERLGMHNVATHERELMAYATHELSRIPGLHMIGTAPEKAGAMSFVLDGIASEDMGRILDQDGIAVRAGHHCAQPTMDRFGVTATVRPSLALYNTHGDIDALVRAIRKALRH